MSDSVLVLGGPDLSLTLGRSLSCILTELSQQQRFLQSSNEKSKGHTVGAQWLTQELKNKNPNYSPKKTQLWILKTNQSTISVPTSAWVLLLQTEQVAIKSGCHGCPRPVLGLLCRVRTVPRPRWSGRQEAALCWHLLYKRISSHLSSVPPCLGFPRYKLTAQNPISPHLRWPLTKPWQSSRLCADPSPTQPRVTENPF